MSPAKLHSLLQGALVHHRAGRLDEAETSYRQARVAAPKNFDALHLSGLLAFQQERFPEAVDLLRRAHAIDRRNAACAMRLGLALLALKKNAEAEEYLRRAVAVKPDFPEGWENLAYCLKTRDQIAEALVCHQRVVALTPRSAPAWCNFGLALSLAGRPVEALAAHERALAADAGYGAARYGRAQALHQTHRIQEAVADYDAVIKFEPRHLGARSNRLFALHNLEGVSREELFAEHVAYGKIVAPAAPQVAPSRKWDSGKRLRLAILSPDLRQHSCAYFLEPLLRHIRPEDFEVFLYHDHFREDAVSARLRALAAVWRNFIGESERSIEQTICADAPDILIDLAGHTGITNRLPLFARRLAPVQVTYLGYPNTTGVPAMDYRFTDAVADPPGEADGYATETLVRFSPTAWCYAAPADAPAVVDPPCRERGYVTFGGFNDPGKITDPMLAFWARILQDVPAARLRLKGRGLGESSVRDAFQRRLDRAGLSADRVDLCERTAETRQHLEQYGQVDIALDSFPYHGTTTTCEALWMGVPVVSRVGDRHVSRVGASLLCSAGHPEWLANDEDDYVRIAVDLAGNAERLAEIRRHLRPLIAASPLCDAVGQSARFAGALRACWTAACERGSQRAAGSVGA